MLTHVYCYSLVSCYLVEGFCWILQLFLLMRARQYHIVPMLTQHTFSKFIEHIKLVVVKGFYIYTTKSIGTGEIFMCRFSYFSWCQYILNVQFNCALHTGIGKQEQIWNQIEQKLCKHSTYCIALELTIAIAFNMFLYN